MRDFGSNRLDAALHGHKSVASRRGAGVHDPVVGVEGVELGEVVGFLLEGFQSAQTRLRSVNERAGGTAGERRVLTGQPGRCGRKWRRWRRRCRKEHASWNSKVLVLIYNFGPQIRILFAESAESTRKI